MGVVLSRTEVEALLPGGREMSRLSRPRPTDGVTESPDWPVETLQRLETRLEAAAAELAVAMSERIATGATGDSAAVSIQYLGLAPGARLPGCCETVGTWVIQGPRPRETGRIAIEASLAVGLVGGLLGGADGADGDSAAEPGRQLSGLERSLLTRAVELIAAVFVCVRDERDSQQWEAARADLSVRAETALASADQRSDCVLAGFGWQLRNCQGLVHVELSSGFIERLTESESVAGRNCGSAAGESGSSSSTTLVVQMPVSGLTAAAIEGLALGDVILTGREVEADTGEAAWDVRVDGLCRYSGQAGTFDGARAVVLESRNRVQ